MTFRLSSSLAVALMLSASMAQAQTTPSRFPPSRNTEQNPLRNVSAGALAERSPGNMVGAGVARTLAAADFGRGIIEITATLPGPDPKAGFLVEAIGIVFAELNRTLLVLGNALLGRAGLPPLVPVEL